MAGGKGLPRQLRFPWATDESGRARPSPRKRQSRRTRGANNHSLAWPPRRGEKVYFQTNLGIQGGVLRETRQGLVWLDYILEDGTVVPEHDLVMCPEPTPWREASTVSEAERKACVARVKAVLDADLDLRKVPKAWADLLQYMAYTLLKILREREVLDGGSANAGGFRPAREVLQEFLADAREIPRSEIEEVIRKTSASHTDNASPVAK